MAATDLEAGIILKQAKGNICQIENSFLQSIGQASNSSKKGKKQYRCLLIADYPKEIQITYANSPKVSAWLQNFWIYQEIYL